MPKIAEKLQEVNESGVTPVSFEFFPPRTEKGVENLKTTLGQMRHQSPVFVDFTWGAGGSTSDLTMSLAEYAQKAGFEVNMHLTCTNMPMDLVDKALVSAKAAGIKNIVALRGDPPKGQETWVAAEGGFTCALDLVQYIRKIHGDHFGIAVAGYPEGHPNVIKPVEDVESLSESEKGRLVVLETGEALVCSDADFAAEIAYLKAKVDAGADLILTQMFFDVEVFLKFVEVCKAAGINVPILPGIMPITKIAGFKKMAAFCKTRVPSELRELLASVEHDAAAVERVGLEVMSEVCDRLVKEGFPLHFYTLNTTEATYGILKKLDLLKDVVEGEL
jgi:methylenetetrahydrofolate reductase (NADPH)